MDRRVARTKKSLQDALWSLLREKPFEEIEIQAITDRADTARVTFYRHYGTKEELLLDILERDYQTLQENRITPSFEDILDFRNIPPTYVMFSILAQERALSKNLFMSRVNTLIHQRMRQYIVEQVVLSAKNSPQYANLPIVMIANHIASVAIANVSWWLIEDLPYSVEYMANITHWMAVCGALNMIGRGDLITMPNDHSWLTAT